MLLSLVIPTYSNCDLVPRALASILATERESDLEVVLVNDGAGDAARRHVKLLSEFSHWAYVESDNRGLAAARNRGIRVAAGSWILCLDDDDELTGGYLSTVLAMAIDEHAEVNCVAPRILIEQSQGATEWGGASWSAEGIATRNLLPYCSAFRRNLWESVGGYNEQLRGYEDWDLWLRARHLIRPWLLGEVGLIYHRRTGGLLSAVQPIDVQLRAQLVLGSADAYADEEVAAARKIVAGEAGGQLPTFGIFGRARVLRDDTHTS